MILVNIAVPKEEYNGVMSSVSDALYLGRRNRKKSRITTGSAARSLEREDLSDVVARYSRTYSNDFSVISRVLLDICDVREQTRRDVPRAFAKRNSFLVYTRTSSSQRELSLCAHVVVNAEECL